MSNIHNIAILNAQLDPDFFPEIECHELYQDEYVKHKVDDESDFGYVCRYHEQHMEEKLDVHATAEAIVDRVQNYVWIRSFWDRADALLHHTPMSANDIWDDASARAERSVAELENY